MKQSTKRIVRLHGSYKKYYDKDLEVYADSMFNLCNILFVEIFPELKNEKHLSISFETDDGVITELFDPEQEIHSDQTIINIMPNPDGAEISALVYAIISAIISIGVSLLLAPKLKNTSDSASGANWETSENVVGQGGVLPVALGTRLIGSRVASYGIDSDVYVGKTSVAADVQIGR